MSRPGGIRRGKRPFPVGARPADQSRAQHPQQEKNINPGYTIVPADETATATTGSITSRRSRSDSLSSRTNRTASNSGRGRGSGSISGRRSRSGSISSRESRSHLYHHAIIENTSFDNLSMASSMNDSSSSSDERSSTTNVLSPPDFDDITINADFERPMVDLANKDDDSTMRLSSDRGDFLQESILQRVTNFFESSENRRGTDVEIDMSDFNNGRRISETTECLYEEIEFDSTGESSASAPNIGKIKIYFMVWNEATMLAMAFNVFMYDWESVLRKNSWSLIIGSCIFLVIQGILQWSVLEIPLMSFATLLVKPEPDRMADGKNLSVIINYNLLASNRDEVDATLDNAYSAYANNLSPTVVAVMVSATGQPDLKQYELEKRDICRTLIHDLVMKEGRQWAKGNIIDKGRADRCFEPYRNCISGKIDRNFRREILPALAASFANNFMVIQRVSRSLRKCGQYQDLMLLSEGCNRAWTYTSNELYKELARKFGEHVFYPSDDVDNVQGREFDYTLVLDGDTGVVKDSLCTLMDIAAANPERAILQPSIKIFAKEQQSLFMHIDAMRQQINEPVSAALTTLMGRSGFYGKGLLQNKLYIEAMLGEEENPIEKVPVDVLSHDTFEAAALSPLYVNSVHLLEEPCGNYVTWDIRECRWNRGELVLSHYFFPKTVGRMFTFLMHRVRQKPPPKLILRTETHLDKAGAYIAHSALRQMLLKPLLLLYIVGRVWLKTFIKKEWIMLCIVMFSVLILPKFAIYRKGNLHKLVVETV